MLKNAFWLFVFAALILIFFLPVVTELQDKRAKIAKYEQEIEDLKLENERMKQEKNLLENDPVYLEKVAREKLGIVKKGEVIYRFEK